jgi:ParB family transcriptional regulator, chromosome partitioning protein
VAAAAATATPGRATVLILGLLLGALEDGISRATWRAPSAAARAYFTALQSWGYALSDVEQLVLQPDQTPELGSAAASTGPAGPTTDDPSGPDGVDTSTDDPVAGTGPVALDGSQQAD